MENINEKLYSLALVLLFSSLFASFVFGLVLQNGIVSLILFAVFVVLSFVVCVFTDDGNKFSM